MTHQQLEMQAVVRLLAAAIRLIQVTQEVQIQEARIQEILVEVRLLVQRRTQ